MLPVLTFRRGTAIAPCILLASLCALPLAAQQNPRQPQAATSSPYLIQSNVNLVLMDVVVSRHGKPVPGLQQQSFRVTDDGHPQPIVYFQEHQPTPTSAAALSQPSLAPHTFTNAAPIVKTSAVNIILLDDLNTPLSDQTIMRRQALAYLRRNPLNAPAAIFVLTSQLNMLQSFTTSRVALERAIQSPQAVASPTLSLRSGASLVTALGLINSSTSGQQMSTGPYTTPFSGSSQMGGGSPQGSSGLEPASPITAMSRSINSMSAQRQQMRIEMTTLAMQQLARYLAAIPGRKNLIWLSDSFPLIITPAAKNTPQDPFYAAQDFSDQVAETGRLFYASRVAVYPVYAAGVATPDAMRASNEGFVDLSQVDNHSGLSATNPEDNNSTASQKAFAAQDAMGQIANQTGGHSYINVNNIQSAIASAIRSGSSYYTIAYAPKNQRYNGAFHRVRIRIDQKGYQLTYPHGYYARSLAPSGAAQNNSATSSIRAALLPGMPPATQILFRTQILSPGDPLLKDQMIPHGNGGEMTASLKGPKHQIIINLKIFPGTLHYDHAANGRLTAQLGATIVAYSPEGRRFNYITGAFHLHFPPSQLAAIQHNGIAFRTTLWLPQKQSLLRIAIYDPTTGQVGSLQIPVSK